MAITSVKEIGEGRTVNESNFVKRYTRVYKVVSDAIITDMATIKTATDGVTAIPTLYTSTYPSDATLAVSAIDVRPINDTYEIFEVFVTYEAPPAGGWYASPPSRPWVASVSSIEQTWLPIKALNAGPANREPGGPIAVGGNVANIQVNSANDPWDNPIEDVRKLMTINLKKAYLVAPTLANLRSFTGSVNNAAITILGENFNARELWLDVYDVGDKQIDTAGNDFYNVNYRIVVAPEDSQGNRGTWDIDVLDVGWKDKNGDKILVGQNSNEIPVAPQPLDGTGVKGGAGVTVYLQNRVKVEKNWAGFAFPGTWP